MAGEGEPARQVVIELLLLGNASEHFRVTGLDELVKLVLQPFFDRLNLTGVLAAADGGQGSQTVLSGLSRKTVLATRRAVSWAESIRHGIIRRKNREPSEGRVPTVLRSVNARSVLA